jgi:dTDP-4-dehydrorhamnose 3,5-epimerase
MKFILDSKRANMVYVPAGCAHGFAALEDSIFLYKCTAVYKPEAEGGIQWNDPELNIDWDLNRPLVSQKDQLLPLFKEALTLNTF